jgi:hypothetical protein
VQNELGHIVWRPAPSLKLARTIVVVVPVVVVRALSHSCWPGGIPTHTIERSHIVIAVLNAAFYPHDSPYMENTWLGLASVLIGAGVIGIIGAVVLVKMGFGRPIYGSVSKASRAAIKAVTKRFRRRR